MRIKKQYGMGRECLGRQERGYLWGNDIWAQTAGARPCQDLEEEYQAENSRCLGPMVAWAFHSMVDLLTWMSCWYLLFNCFRIDSIFFWPSQPVGDFSVPLSTVSMHSPQNQWLENFSCRKEDSECFQLWGACRSVTTPQFGSCVTKADTDNM